MTLQFLGGRVVLVDSVKQLRSTTQDPSRNLLDKVRDPKADCLRSLSGKVAGDLEVLGIKERIANRDAVRLDQKQAKSWFALDLGCAPLAVQSGPNNRVLNELKAGEPASSLFVVDSRLKEVKPSEFYGLDPTAAAAVSQDTFYLAHRPRK